MATTTIKPPGTGIGGPGKGHGGGDGDGRRRHGGSRRDPLPLGMLFGLSSIAMLFIAMTSAYVVRRGLGSGWTDMRMPQALWLSTAALLASSLALEKGRRSAGHGLGRWVGATLALGLLFVAAQTAAWRALRAQGIYLSSNPHSAFFYLLTALHGLHVIGGLAALSWLRVTVRSAPPAALTRRVTAISMYWHFMLGLWLYLLALLFGRI